MPAAIAAAERDVLDAARKGDDGAEDGAGEADQPQRCTIATMAPAATWCGSAGSCAARRDRRRSMTHEGKRIERRDAADHAIRRGIGPAAAWTADRCGPADEQFPEVALARRVVDGLRSRLRRTATGRTRSGRTATIAGSRWSARAAARCRSRSTRNVPCSFFEDLALLGEDGDALLRVAPVVDEDAEQLPVRAALADVEGEAAVDGVKRPGCTMLLTQVGAHLGRPAPQHRAGPWATT